MLLNACTVFLCSAASAIKVSSPDGGIVTTVTLSKLGELSYSIIFNKETVLYRSKLGIVVDTVDLGKNCTLISVSRSSYDTVYQTRGVHNIARDHYQQAILQYANKGNGTKFYITVRAYDDGVAYRYNVPGTSNHLINGENSQWVIPDNSTVWYNMDYEELHHHDRSQNLKTGFAVMPVTIALRKNQGFMTLTEGNLVNYCGSRLKFKSGNRIQIDLVGRPTVEGEIETPWRLTIISRNLNGLVNSDLVTDVCPSASPELQHADWIKPGRAVWSWWAAETVGPEEQKRYVDMGSKLGFEYNLIDGGWDKWPDAWGALKDVVDYSEKKNIHTWVWMHSRDLADKTARNSFFKRVKETGVVGVKIDFFPPENIETVNYYNDILSEAAHWKLMINFHGTNKPTGRMRTWPNDMTQEGIRGQEWHITRYNRTEPFDQGTILPFTRFIVGPGDYTPCALNPKELRGFSWTHEYAEAVIFTSPVQHFADDPKFYLESPGKELLMNMPSVWDETIVLPGSKIGEVAAFARRKGNCWYVAVVNGNHARDFQIHLSFLGKGLWDLVGFADNLKKEDDMKPQGKRVSGNATLKFRIRAGGGYIARLTER